LPRGGKSLPRGGKSLPRGAKSLPRGGQLSGVMEAAELPVLAVSVPSIGGVGPERPNFVFIFAFFVLDKGQPSPDQCLAA
jgi:hypothetical protein